MTKKWQIIVEYEILPKIRKSEKLMKSYRIQPYRWIRPIMIDAVANPQVFFRIGAAIAIQSEGFSKSFFTNVRMIRVDAITYVILKYQRNVNSWKHSNFINDVASFLLQTHKTSLEFVPILFLFVVN